jgi:lysine-N-methylase
VKLPTGPDRNHPSYAAAFRCIGPECEDDCCHGWTIPLDRRTYENYQLFPVEKLGSIVQQYVTEVPDEHASLHARINLAPSGYCPFFGADRLCGIQKEYGAALLSSTCSIYPRTLNGVDGVLEGSLTLSCPEAARNVLLDPDAMQVAGDLLSGAFRTDSVAMLAGARSSIHKPYGYFHEVRALLIDVVKDRTRPLWQRLLLIGSLCERLDRITSAEEDATVPAMLAEYREVIENRWLHVELESVPSNPALKLKVIFQLTDNHIKDPVCGARFRDTFWTFVEGIAAPQDASTGDDVGRFLEAEKRYHRPFFERSPHILENYLINYMYQTLFPFGLEGSVHFRQQGIFDEYILMTTQFAWMNGLLVGIAAHYREKFAEEHVVRTVQAFTRATGHYPHVLAWINEQMKKIKFDSLAGMAVLLKN